MTVRELKRILETCNDDAIVYIGNPNHFKDFQTAHEDVGARYVVSANEGIWFETYRDENIEEEVDAIIEEWMNSGDTDIEFVEELLLPDRHGYTLEDIKKNCKEDVYEFVLRIANEQEMFI